MAALWPNAILIGFTFIIVRLNKGIAEQLIHVNLYSVSHARPFVCLCFLVAYIANNMDQDQTAPWEQSDQGT